MPALPRMVLARMGWPLSVRSQVHMTPKISLALGFPA